MVVSRGSDTAPIKSAPSYTVILTVRSTSVLLVKYKRVVDDHVVYYRCPFVMNALGKTGHRLLT